MKFDKELFKEKLELLDTILSIFLSIATIIGFILAYQSEFGKICKELIQELHYEYVMIKQDISD